MDFVLKLTYYYFIQKPSLQTTAISATIFTISANTPLYSRQVSPTSIHSPNSFLDLSHFTFYCKQRKKDDFDYLKSMMYRIGNNCLCPNVVAILALDEIPLVHFKLEKNNVKGILSCDPWTWRWCPLILWICKILAGNLTLWVSYSVICPLSTITPYVKIIMLVLLSTLFCHEYSWHRDTIWENCMHEEAVVFLFPSSNSTQSHLVAFLLRYSLSWIHRCIVIFLVTGFCSAIFLINRL